VLGDLRKLALPAGAKGELLAIIEKRIFLNGQPT